MARNSLYKWGQAESMARNKTKIGDKGSASEIFRFQKIRFEGLQSVRKRCQFPLGQSMGGYSTCEKKLKT